MNIIEVLMNPSKDIISNLINDDVVNNVVSESDEDQSLDDDHINDDDGAEYQSSNIDESDKREASGKISENADIILKTLESQRENEIKTSLIAKAAKIARDRAGQKSSGKCAKYVRTALNSAGIITPNHPTSADKYDPYLEKIGFTRINMPLNAENQIGDIEILPKNQKHKYGHIQIFDGSNWVSDFIQKTEYPSTAYINNADQRGYKIVFRYA